MKSTAFPDRSQLFARLSEDEIVARYQRVWGPEVGLDELKAQARLEGELTDRLLRSTPENRWSEFSEAYGRLFSELPWHRTGESPTSDRDYEIWRRLLGPARTVLEIGSGGGGLIRHLAARGVRAYGSEVTRERGEKFVPKGEGVEWLQTDGVNLSRFVAEDSFDAVISDQVFEHLHPDDHLAHLAEARKVLTAGGRYIVRAPHRSAGPRDLSEIFGLDKAVFLHLCEPDYGLMHSLCLRAGFDRVSAVLASGRLGVALYSPLFLRYQLVIERFESKIAPSQEQKRRFRKVARRLLAADAVWIVAEKARPA